MCWNVHPKCVMVKNNVLWLVIMYSVIFSTNLWRYFHLQLRIWQMLKAYICISSSMLKGEYHIRKWRMQRVNTDMFFTLFTLWSERKQRIQSTYVANVIYVCDALQNSTIGWSGDKLLNTGVIFVFFAHKNYSSSFLKLQLNQWYHMDYFNDVLATFLSLDRVRILGVYEGSESSRNTSKVYTFVFRRWTKVLPVWNDMGVSN